MSQQAEPGRAPANSVRRDTPAAPVAPPAAKSSWVLPAAVIVVVGALLTGLVAGIFLAPARSVSAILAVHGASEPKLAKLAPSQIAKAIGTLDPATSQQVVADAKSCKTPLAWITLAREHGKPDGSVRIRAGSYLSPPFHVTEKPQDVAIPFPAAYPGGHGVLWVIGKGKGITVDIDPRWTIDSLDGAAALDVIWDDADPC
jgi:hypothetical protein